MNSSLSGVFISYSHSDESWKDQLVRHLQVLELQGALDLWDDRRIAPGENWRPAITQALESARVALLLVSANSLTSRFILDDEVPVLLRRRASEGLRLVPVILRPCAWQEVVWLSSIAVFPRDGRPLSSLTEPEVDSQLALLTRDVRRSLSHGQDLSAGEGSPATVPPVTPPPPTEVQRGRQGADPLDGYDLIKVIYLGNYGRVLKCRAVATDSVCIVKETDARHVSLQALNTLARNRCPNVATARRVWEADGNVYEELPYIGGRSLQQLVTPGVGGLAGSVLESFHEQLDRTLSTMHRAGIVHRDIHPANVYFVIRSQHELVAMSEEDVESSWLFDAFGYGAGTFTVAWILVDCTFATLESNVEQIGYRHGAYTPQEQEDAAATTASDMYAFGATMYYAITGRDPPSARNRALGRREDLDIPRFAHPSPEFRDHLQRLLSVRQSDRPAAGSHEWRGGSVASSYCGTLELDSDQFLIVDTFPSETRLVDRAEALKIHRRLWSPGSEEPGSARAYWIERLAETPRGRENRAR